MTGAISVEFTPEQRTLASALIEALSQSLSASRHGSRPVIAIAGESGSGKTVTARCLAHAWSVRGIRTDVIHQDDYFHRPPATNHAHRVRDLATVGPQEVNLSLLRAHVAAFRAAATAVVAPRVVYAEDRFEEVVRDFADVDVLVVEGTYVIAEVTADARVFLSATSDDTRARRRMRNRDIDAPIVDQVLAIEHPIIAGQAALADIIVDRAFRITRS